MQGNVKRPTTWLRQFGGKAPSLRQHPDSYEAASIVADARAHGVNYIDVIDVYIQRASETMEGGRCKL